MYKIKVLHKGKVGYIKNTLKNRLTVTANKKYSYNFIDLSSTKIVRDEALGPHYHFSNICIIGSS